MDIQAAEGHAKAFAELLDKIKEIIERVVEAIAAAASERPKRRAPQNLLPQYVAPVMRVQFRARSCC